MDRKPGSAALRHPPAAHGAQVPEIDTNKDGVIERVELTAYAVRQFLGTEPTLSFSSPPLGGEEHEYERAWRPADRQD